MAAYIKALQEGQLLPRWAGELNYGYGMPLFNFIYHVPYLITSIPISMGAGLVLSFKIGLLVSFVLSGVFMFMFASSFFRNRQQAYIATLLYQFAPFHLLDLVVRGDIAEGYALSFLPLVLYALTESFRAKNGNRAVLGISIATLLLIASHNAISLVFFGIASLFVIVFAPSNTRRLRGFIGLGSGLLLAAFYWVPALMERRFTYGDLFMKDMYKSHFAPILNFFIPNFTNAKSLQTEGIAVSFGLMQIIVCILALLLIFRKKLPKDTNLRVFWFSLGLVGISLFVMEPVSRLFWSSIPILRMFQFPWRFLNVVVFATAFGGAVVLAPKPIPHKLLVAILVVAVMSSFVYFRPPLGFDKIDEQYFWNYPLNTTYFGETDVIWSAGPAGSYPKQRFEVIEGKGEITDPLKKGTLHTFTVTAETPVRVVDRTQYFPGWRAYADGDKLPVEFQDQNWRGLITFMVPAGVHHIRVAFEESPIRMLAEMISVMTLAVLLFWQLFPQRLPHSHETN